MRDNSEFYRKHEFLPTRTQLDMRSEAVLQNYNQGRRYLFEYCLKIPLKTLCNSDYLEIGPDSGENVVSAASFGARVSCVDANPLAIRHTLGLIEQTKYLRQLDEAVLGDFLEVQFNKKFDFVVAEGLIHSVESKKMFIEKMIDSAKPDSFLILSYYDQVSIFADLFHSRVFRTLAKSHLQIGDLYEDNLEEVIEFGEILFTEKWRRKTHLRSLRTWILDILLNPVMSATRTIDVVWLIKLVNKHGFRFWSSYPSYRDSSEIRWHRDYQSEESLMEKVLLRYQERTLETMLGIQIPNISESDQEILEAIMKNCLQLNCVLSSEDWTRVHLILAEITSQVNDEKFRAGSKIMELNRILEMLSHICKMLSNREFDALIELISKPSESNQYGQIFNDFWGQPNHYIALKRDS